MIENSYCFFWNFPGRRVLARLGHSYFNRKGTIMSPRKKKIETKKSASPKTKVIRRGRPPKGEKVSKDDQPKKRRSRVASRDDDSDI
jgi:hypothetical protein